MKNPPILISVIGFFAAVAGLANIFFGVSVLGFKWFGALGDFVAFDNVGVWGWLAVAIGILWLLVAVGLWTLRTWAWLAAMVIAGVSLFEAFLALLQWSSPGIGFGMAMIPVIILLYLNSATVKAAFGVADPAAAA